MIYGQLFSFLMLIAFTKNCIVSSVRLQFSHYSYWDPENISLVRDLATVLFQLLTMVDYQRKFSRRHGRKKCTLLFNLLEYRVTGVSWLDEEERSERSGSKGPFLLSSSRLSSPSSSPFAVRLWWKLGREEKGRKQRSLSLLWFSPSSTPPPLIPRSDPLKAF